MNSRSFQPHVTVATIAEDQGRFLLVREWINGHEEINNPAGHLEAGETPAAAAARECLEETGYRFRPESSGGIYLWRAPSSGETFVRINFIGVAGDYAPDARLDEGIIAPIWLSLEETMARESKLRSPLVLRSLRDYRAGIRFPLSVITSLLES